MAGDQAPPAPIRFEPAFGVVPANHLKFYLHFNEPMARGEVFRHLRLVETDEKGKEVAEVPDPFRDVELWDESFTRLTLWLHPGRQKPGVNLNVEIGPILEEGKRYALEVSGAWRTESGREIAKASLRHRFTALAMDEKQPDPERWELLADRGTLFIRTNDLLDPVSLNSSLRWQTADGQSLEGFGIETAPLCGEGAAGVATGILLTAPRTLSPGAYRLVIDPKLEDLAGNSIARPFNLDLQKQPDFKERKEPVMIPFVILPKE